MPPLPAQPARTIHRIAVSVRGVVQGVGFRPFVYNEARRLGLSGFVHNRTDTVRVEAQGPPDALAALLDALRHRLPPQTRIDAMDVEELPCAETTAGGFEIRASSEDASPRPVVPADLATCHACLDEIRTPGQRRYRYPFTNCTNCGPRWSILEGLPYDRSRTTMAGFEMCADCRAEYENPADRRFHAQPIACPRCGPRLVLLDPSGRELAVADAALRAAVESLRRGEIVALKGLGGFQLLVDATDPSAVARLRERKRRPDRPLAIMVASLDEARRCCEVSASEAEVLESVPAPIVLLSRRGILAEPQAAPAPSPPTPGPWLVAPAVAPGNPYLGVMLPYTPLHHLLCEAVGRPIVCTSGNLSEEPMAVATEEAIRRLGPIADGILTHDRPIARPVDDSVVRVGPDGLQVLRRARGFAPLPLGLQGVGGQGSGVRGECLAAAPTRRDAEERPGAILAVGGHLKNAVALALPDRAVAEFGGIQPHESSFAVVLGAHVGDLDNVLSVEVFERAIADLLRFFRVAPEAIACDLHPDYASTRHAEALAASHGAPLLRFQHHHAHVAACMAEHGLGGPVLGIAWDGTGHGGDGTIWGGEALLCENDRFERVGHLRTFPLPGGDRATRQPRRSALGLLYEVLGDRAAGYARHWFTEEELRVLLAALGRGVNCPRTSSMGRLFDAVAALGGLPATITFEGQAAMALEFAADATETSAYPLPLRETARGVGGTAPLVADWEPLLADVLRDRRAGVRVGSISARFHNALAELCVGFARRGAVEDVILTGGCFQNALLTARARQRLLENGFRVYTHRRVPPGDGGIALGQVYLAARTPGPQSRGFLRTTAH